MSGGLAARRALLLISLLAAGSLGAKEARESDPWIHGIFTGHSPRPVEVDSTGAWDRATREARSVGNALVLVGTGRSMQPLYPSGTVLVLRPVSYDQLRPGQTAVYRNREARAVAHVLVTRTRDGWRARGLNNRRHDLEPVKPDNLLGVVVAAYQPTRIAATRVREASAFFLSDSR